jgi:hypothetical protein
MEVQDKRSEADRISASSNLHGGQVSWEEEDLADTDPECAQRMGREELWMGRVKGENGSKISITLVCFRAP